MPWDTVSMPPRAVGFLNAARAKVPAGRKQAAKVQEFAAAVAFFASLPLEERLLILREYVGFLAMQSETDVPARTTVQTAPTLCSLPLAASPGPDERENGAQAALDPANNSLKGLR